MRDPFAAPSRRPWFVPEGTSMLEEARLVAARHAAEKAASSELESRIGNALKANDKVEARKGKAEDPQPSSSQPDQR